MSRNIDIVIKEFKDIATDNRDEQHYWQTRPNPNSNTLAYMQKACESAEYHEQVAAWLTELQERREADRWIPVSERLPEDETRVLTCNAEGDMLVCCGSRSTEIEGRFIWYTNGWRYGEVIAWKPLPEPYKESEATNE